MNNGIQNTSNDSTPTTIPVKSETAKKTNLAPSAIFVKQNILDKFYPILRKEGLIIEANEIIVDKNPEGETRTIEFRIKCHELAKKEIENMKNQGGDPETVKKKENAWNNFSSALVANVKPEIEVETDIEAVNTTPQE